MTRHFLRGFCVIILSSFISHAQVSAPPFVAVNVGTFVSSVAGFDRIYNSRLAFAFGGSLGIPVSSQLYLFAKYTTCSKSDVAVSSTSYFLDGQHFTTPQTVTGMMSMRQWLINFGVLRKVLPSKDFALEIDGGLTYSRFSWWSGWVYPGAWAPDSPVKNHEMAGFFAGITLEHKFPNSPIALIIDAQYNHLWSVSSPYVSNYGAFNIAGGVRLYFRSQ